MFSDVISKNNYVDFFVNTISSFGGVSRGKEKYILRKNINTPFPDSGAYFGCISEDEEPAGAYSDLSIVVFPSNESDVNDDRWIVALGVGSLGLKNDDHIASLPGTRRLFVNSLTNDTFVKNEFLDVESQDGFATFCDSHNIPETLKAAVKNYQKVLLVSSFINPNDVTNSERVIKTYLAIYASLRKWPSNAKQKKDVADAINGNRHLVNEEKEIVELLTKRKYIVLQGAPGTGKTRIAKKITEGEKNVFFTQFHAETAYSDFVYGIVPDVDSQILKYKSNKGVFINAIEKAKELEDSGSSEKVYLIIDEINRANLSNVLGPAFYLFEPTMTGSGAKIDLCPGLSVEKLPENLYVIATMNTADRSLAVVDFALRRRFAWYTMYPHVIEADDGYVFCTVEFNNVAEIFERYGTDEELNLLPGQAYYVVPENDSDEAMRMRMKYEIMPLIKEYLMDGMLSRAKDDFVNYFRDTLGEELFR